MNAIQLLRSMHADTKVRFRIILGTDDAQVANQGWRALQPVLKLHEEIEDQFVFLPLREEMGPGSPLGDWAAQHDVDVDYVDQLISASNEVAPGTPEWRMRVARVMDALSKHVVDEEGQIFGRVEQVWDADRLEQAGDQMQKRVARAAPTKSTTKPEPARRRR
jgi:hypothetical protein